MGKIRNLQLLRFCRKAGPGHHCPSQRQQAGMQQARQRHYWIFCRQNRQPCLSLPPDPCIVGNQWENRSDPLPSRERLFIEWPGKAELSAEILLELHVILDSRSQNEFSNVCVTTHKPSMRWGPCSSIQAWECTCVWDASHRHTDGSMHVHAFSWANIWKSWDLEGDLSEVQCRLGARRELQLNMEGIMYTENLFKGIGILY